MMPAQNKAMVQATNSTSIVSKNSACAKGYYDDPYLHFFGTCKQRTALINRGYYIRAKALSLSLKKFMESLPDEHFQIISFGAGYDTTYFKLKSQYPDHQFLFIEIDFGSLLKKKLKTIFANKELESLIGSPKQDILAHPNLLYASSSYVAVGADMCKLKELKLSLNAIPGFDAALPTLLLSECVLSYLPAKKGDKLIQWAATTFPNAAFLAYEQAYPDDSFGVIMQNHFKSLQSPLQSLSTYSTLEQQRERYLDLGWQKCSITNMNDFFNSLSEEERQRIDHLEVFDEYEEWHLKCAHYTFLCAHQGMLFNLIPSRPLSKFLDQEKDRPALPLYQGPSCPNNQRCAHRSVLTEDYIVTLGGYGTDPQLTNQRLKSIAYHHIESLHDGKAKIQLDGLKDSLMHFSLVSLPKGDLLLFGGRSSPFMVSNSTFVFNNSPETKEPSALPYFVARELETQGETPSPRWRHSGNLVSGEILMIFGGITEDNRILGDCHLLNLQSKTWTQVDGSPKFPCPRHSHSSVSSGNSAILSGGLDASARPLSSIYRFNLPDRWERVDVSGPLMPRYSHTSHLHENRLLLVGGVNTSIQQPGIGVVDLETYQVTEFAFPNPLDTKPFLCYKHSSIISGKDLVILGGGGYCFSFGIHINSRLGHVPLSDLTEAMRDHKEAAAF